MENYFVYMGEVNREILANRSAAKIANQIIAPSGTDDPFYYQIEQHYGASDHEVFNNWTTHVPGVMLITWPDLYYHTSEDIPNKLDATQLKRAAVIAAAGAYTVAAADENMAIAIAGNIFTNASKRMGIELSRGLDELYKTNDERFENTAKKVTAYLETAFINEKATIESVRELAPLSEKLQKQLVDLTILLKQIYTTDKSVLAGQIDLTALSLGVKVPSSTLNILEKKASEIVPSVTENVKSGEFGIERKIREIPKETLDKYPYRDISSTTELCTLVNGKNSVLDMKKMLDSQFKQESDLQSIINYLELLKMKELVAF
jgi:hypothetical protein